VLIVGGMYKCFKTGTCVGRCGYKIVKVLIDGDKERNIWQSSIAPFMKEEKKKEDFVVRRQECNELLQEIDALIATVERLELKAKLFDK